MYQWILPSGLIHMELSIVYTKGSLDIVSKKYCIHFSEDRFCLRLANSADPDEMPRYVAFHPGHHCLQSTHLVDFQSSKGQSIIPTPDHYN